MSNLPAGKAGNKFTTYLLYAIGEIILVVVGILIAVSLNNLNENRKLENTELKMLFEIKQNLQECKREIDYMVRANQKSVESYVGLKKHVEEKLPFHDSLEADFGELTRWTSPYLTYTAYESLKQKGVDLIQNDSLRKNITDMYEGRFAYLVNDWDRAEWRDSESVITPYFIKNFSYRIDSSRSDYDFGVPNDYDALVEDPEFRSILGLLILNRSWGNRVANEVSERIDLLVAEIEEELKTRRFILEN